MAVGVDEDRHPRPVLSEPIEAIRQDRSTQPSVSCQLDNHPARVRHAATLPALLRASTITARGCRRHGRPDGRRSLAFVVDTCSRHQQSRGGRCLSDREQGSTHLVPAPDDEQGGSRPSARYRNARHAAATRGATPDACSSSKARARRARARRSLLAHPNPERRIERFSANRRSHRESGDAVSGSLVREGECAQGRRIARSHLLRR
jgi:hypothetical protein